MRVRIRTVDVSTTEALRRFAEHVVLSTFHRMGDAVRELEVRLRDLNGPKGGVDQEVLVIGRMSGQTLAVRVVEADAYQALRSGIALMAKRVRARRART